MRFLVSLLFVALSGCASVADFNQQGVNEVHTLDFISSDINSCKPSDVDLTNSDAQAFFQTRSKLVTHKTLHDYYEWAPCYAVGSMKYMEEVCEWKIYASAIGSIKCGDRVWYFACDDGCNDLLTKTQ